jgi:signal transduction histidine kinase
MSEALDAVTEDLCGIAGATAALLYLANDCILAPRPADEGGGSAQLRERLVLASESCGAEVHGQPTLIELSSSPDCEDLGEELIGQLPAVQGHAWIRFGSPKAVLVRGEIFLSVPHQPTVTSESTCLAVSDYLRSSTPVLEAIFRRQLWREYRAVLCISGSALMRFPHEPLRAVLERVCGMLGVEGASLFVRAFADPPEALRLVATWPKEVPRGPISYDLEERSPTADSVNSAASCTILDVRDYRQEACLGEETLWCDIEDELKPRTLLITSHETETQSLYVFRCTNSTRGLSTQFHALDVERAREHLVLLSTLHRLLENEYRALKVFLDFSHDINQKMQGIVSASNVVTTLLGRTHTHGEDERELTECKYKLRHIRHTAIEVADLLLATSFPPAPAHDAPRDAAEHRGFLPYAEVVKPVCEMFRDRSESRRVRFRFTGIEQLGPLVMPISDLRRVVENLVSNALKYTIPDHDVMIAFERLRDGGGRIHFASEALPIEPGERERIFEFGYRGEAARALEARGDGIGLTIARYLMRRLNGEISLRCTGAFSVFTVHLSRQLFRGSANG